jgi:D-alanine-D-alanine ligase
MIIENYIAGQEIHVAIMDGKALGAIEVRPHGLFYNYKCKYTSGMTDYIMPAEIDKNKYAEVLLLAEKCFHVAKCRGIARVDFILNNKNNGDNKFYLLEVNTHPGFTATSLVPKIAQYVDSSFDKIVEFLIKNAKCD